MLSLSKEYFLNIYSDQKKMDVKPFKRLRIKPRSRPSNTVSGIWDNAPNYVYSFPKVHQEKESTYVFLS